MAFNITSPNIIGGTDREQLSQIRNYLFKIRDEIQWALNSLDTSATTAITETPKSTLSKTSHEVDGQATFNAVKSLIIKSADIVEAYYQEISKRLEGEYVATSDFGTFKQKTTSDISANSTALDSVYNNLQKISTSIENIEYKLIDVDAHVRSGLLYTGDDGIPVYGLEVGQKNTVDGVEVFNKYARFISDRLSFYDSNDVEVAFISDYKLYITNAEITGILTLGAFEINTTKGFRLKYVGRG